MSFFVDVNYPGVCYVVADELKQAFVDHMVNEGAALREVQWSGRGEDVHVVVAVEETKEFWGLHTKKATYAGRALTDDQLWNFFVYKDEDGHLVKLTKAGLEPIDQDTPVYPEGEDLPDPPDMDREDWFMAIGTAFDEDEDNEPDVDPNADLFDIQDRMNGIRTRY